MLLTIDYLASSLPQYETERRPDFGRHKTKAFLLVTCQVKAHCELAFEEGWKQRL